MDQRERLSDQEESVRSFIEDFLANTWTALPGIVQSFNVTAGTVVVQPSTKSRVRQRNGSFQFVNLPQLFDVPVLFPRGGPFLITFPIQNGDECLVVFSSRSIDGWWQQGGVQLPTEIRLHDLADGFAIVGPYSKPNVPISINTSSVELRTTDRSAYIQLTSDGKVNIVAPGGIHVTGAVTATGEITASGTHTVSAHTHPDPQGGNTGTPNG